MTFSRSTRQLTLGLNIILNSHKKRIKNSKDFWSDRW